MFNWEEELKNWRSSGKLAATKIKLDSTVTKYNWSFYSNKSLKDGNYIVNLKKLSGEMFLAVGVMFV